jgi:hypothetical protein
MVCQSLPYRLSLQSYSGFQTIFFFRFFFFKFSIFLLPSRCLAARPFIWCVKHWHITFAVEVTAFYLKKRRIMSFFNLERLLLFLFDFFMSQSYLS